MKKALPQKIKAVVKGIEEVVELYHIVHSGKFTYTEVASIKIADQKYVASAGDGYEVDYIKSTSSAYQVLEALHKALAIPKHKTAQMVKFLFSNNLCLRDEDIQPLENSDFSQAKRKRHIWGLANWTELILIILAVEKNVSPIV